MKHILILFASLGCVSTSGFAQNGGSDAAWPFGDPDRSPTFAPPPAATPLAQDDEGKQAFTRACQSCHEATPYVKELPQLVAIVRRGSGLMPPLAASQISDEELAAVHGFLTRVGAGTPSSATTMRSAPSQNLEHPQGTNAARSSPAGWCSPHPATRTSGAAARQRAALLWRSVAGAEEIAQTWTSGRALRRPAGQLQPKTTT